MSGYEVTAQFYDAVAEEQHAAVDTKIASLLQGLDPSQGPVVDVGAGTGLTTRTIAAALPGGEIFAIEPHPSMRAALLTRIWSDQDLRRRVTILPTSILDAPLPRVISGAVISAALVHFGPDERQRLWTLLARHLAAGGRVIVEIQCPEAVDLPERLMVTSRIGRIEYEGFAQAQAVEGKRQLWTMTYRTLMNGLEIERQTAEFLCHAVSADQVLSEASEVGLAGELIADLVVLRR